MLLLATYRFLDPWFSTAVLLLLAIEAIAGSRRLLDEDGFATTLGAIPEIPQKILPLAYFLYFGYNLIGGFLYVF